MKTTTVLLCGVGGQGTILAADLLAKTAAASGLEAKISEIHGMSQRGGSVTTIVRFGDEVHTMVADPGYADRIVAFEAVEALRNLHYLAADGAILVNDLTIPSLPVQIGTASMPEQVSETLIAAGATMIPANDIADKLGNPKGANVALVGALSASLFFDPTLWEDIISKRVPPKTIEANIAAFRAGREFAQ